MIGPHTALKEIFNDIRQYVINFSLDVTLKRLRFELEHFQSKDYLYLSGALFMFLSFALTLSGVAGNIYYFHFFQLIFLAYIAFSGLRFGPAGSILSGISVSAIHMVYFLMEGANLHPPLNSFIYTMFAIAVYAGTAIGLSTALYVRDIQILEGGGSSSSGPSSFSFDSELSGFFEDVDSETVTADKEDAESSAPLKDIDVSGISTVSVDDFLVGADKDFAAIVKAKMVRQSNYLSVLQKSAVTVMSSKTEQHMLDSLAKILVTDFRADKVGMIRYDETSKSLFVAAHSNMTPEEISGFRLSMGKGIIGKAIANRQPWSVVTDIVGEAALQAQMRENMLLSVAVIPVFYKEDFLAAINIGGMKSGNFSEEDFRFLLKLSSVISAYGDIKNPAASAQQSGPQSDGSEEIFLDDGDLEIGVDNEYI